MTHAPLVIDGLPNFRDVGGLPLTGGGTTNYDVLFRSAALTQLSDEALAELAASPIETIVDFRSEQERASAPDELPTSRPFTVVEEPLLGGSMTGMAEALTSGTADTDVEIPTLGTLYEMILKEGAADFANLARIIGSEAANPPNAVLVHCTAGKDRTGVACALMLDAVGTERSAIVANYAEA